MSRGRAGEKELPPVPMPSAHEREAKRERGVKGSSTSSSSSMSSRPHQTFAIPPSGSSTAYSALGLSFTSHPNQSSSTLRPRPSPSIASSSHTSSSIRGKAQLFGSKLGLPPMSTPTSVRSAHSSSSRLRNVQFNEFGRRGSEPTLSASPKEGIEKKRSTSTLSGLAKGLNRMGSVIKRSNTDGPLGAASGRMATSRKPRQPAAEPIKEDSLAEEDEDDGWQSVSNVVVDDEGDEGVSRPFNITHDLHVKPDLEDLPTAWIAALRAQGMTENELLLLAAAKKKQHYSQPMLRLVKGSEPPPVRDHALPSPTQVFYNQRGMSTPSTSISTQKRRDAHHQRKASEMLQKFSFEGSRPSSPELTNGSANHRSQASYSKNSDNTGPTSPKIPPGLTRERKRLSKQDVPRGMSSEDETTPSHTSHSASISQRTDSEAEPESDLPDPMSGSLSRSEGTFGGRSVPEFLSTPGSRSSKAQKRLSAQIRGFGALDFSNLDDGWADSLLTAMQGQAGGSSSTLLSGRQGDDRSPLKSHFSSRGPNSPLLATPNSSKRASRRFHPEPLHFKPSSPTYSAGPATPTRSSSKQHSPRSAERQWPTSPPPPPRGDRRHSKRPSQSQYQASPQDKQSSPAKAPGFSNPSSDEDAFPIRKSSDSFGVHYSQHHESRSSVDVDLVTPHTDRPDGSFSLENELTNKFDMEYSNENTPMAGEFAFRAPFAAYAPAPRGLRIPTGERLPKDRVLSGYSMGLADSFPAPPLMAPIHRLNEPSLSPSERECADRLIEMSKDPETQLSSDNEGSRASEAEDPWAEMTSDSNRWRHRRRTLHMSVPASVAASTSADSGPSRAASPSGDEFSRRATPPLPIATALPPVLPATPSRRQLLPIPSMPNAGHSPSPTSPGSRSIRGRTRIDPDDPLQSLDNAGANERASIALSIMSTSSSLNSYSLHEATVHRAYAQVLRNVKEEVEAPIAASDAHADDKTDLREGGGADVEEREAEDDTSSASESGEHPTYMARPVEFKLSKEYGRPDDAVESGEEQAEPSRRNEIARRTFGFEPLLPAPRIEPARKAGLLPESGNSTSDEHKLDDDEMESMSVGTHGSGTWGAMFALDEAARAMVKQRMEVGFAGERQHQDGGHASRQNREELEAC